jgi:hypothetical protein
MVFVPLQIVSKPEPHVSGGAPPCSPQCAGASVGAVLSKLLMTLAPNSLAAWLTNWRPSAVDGLSCSG